MNTQTYEQFGAANRELTAFLQKVDGLANGSQSITAADLQALSKRLATLAPELENVPLLESCGDALPVEVAEYVKHLQALQHALQTVRCIMLARKAQLDSAKHHLHGLQGWVNAYSQTT